jgi:hypothetical protein
MNCVIALCTFDSMIRSSFTQSTIIALEVEAGGTNA